MRGYYAIIGDRPYELPTMSLAKASKIMGEETDHTEVETHPDSKSLTVKVTVSNLTRETWTNKQLVEMFKQFLRDTKTTNITKLADYYTVYIEYELWDDICGETVDHGVGVKTVSPQTFLFPLGLNEESEYVARLGFTLPASVTQKYRPKHPYGMMKPCNMGSQYTLVIRRIWITQLMERAWSIQPNRPLHKPRPHYYSHQHTCGCDAPKAVLGTSSPQWGNPYQMHAPDCGVGPVQSGKYKPHHPSCGTVTCEGSVNDTMLDPKDLAVIYDTADYVRDDYLTVPITFAPEEITIKFTAKTLSPILANKEEISELLGDIKQEIIDADKPPVITPPPTDPDDEDKEPLPGDDKDQQEPDPPTGGNNNNSGDGDGDGDGDDGDPDEPIDGDDKDIGGGLPDPGDGDGDDGDENGENSGGDTGEGNEGSEGNGEDGTDPDTSTGGDEGNTGVTPPDPDDTDETEETP